MIYYRDNFVLQRCLGSNSHLQHILRHTSHVQHKEQLRLRDPLSKPAVVSGDALWSVLGLSWWPGDNCCLTEVFL